MAKRRTSGKLQPVPLILNFELSNLPDLPTERSTHYIDISQCVSGMARKFFRQGENWAIAGGKVFMPDADPLQNGNAFYISTIPRTWMASNAWHKVYAAWKRQQDEALADGDNQSIVAKFRDFKIHADPQHAAAGFNANLLPVNMGPGPSAIAISTMHSSSGLSQLGEWDPSHLVIPNYGAVGTNYEVLVHAVGDDVGGVGGSISMIKAYANSRSVPQSPDPQTPPGVTSNENFLNLMFDMGDNQEDVIDNAVEENNDLPYDQFEYPGTHSNLEALENQVIILNNNTVSQSTYSFGPFQAPCGLLRLDQVNSSGDPLRKLYLQLYLVPGPNRGYLTQRMQDM